MRKALLVLALMGLAIPVSAQENPCVTVEMDHGGGWTKVASHDYQEGAPLASIVGQYVWFSWTDDSFFGERETLSFDATGLASAVACADGSVELVEINEKALMPEAPAPTSESVTLRPVCEVHGDTLVYVCSLPNLTLMIS